MKMIKRLLALAFSPEEGGGGGETPEQKATREAAEAEANKGKTPEQIAADKAAADRAEAEKGWTAEQKAAADAAADAATKAGKTAAEVAAAREEAEKAKVKTETGPKAPAKYELTWPDSSTATAEDVKAFEGWARKLNLTNEQAQAMLEEREAQVDSTLARFLEQTTADPDYGGDKLAETQRLANLIIDRVRPEGHARRDGLLAILEGSGYINNIEVVSFLADLGKLAGEDGTGFAGGGGANEERAEDQMFPTTKKK